MKDEDYPMQSIVAAGSPLRWEEREMDEATKALLARVFADCDHDWRASSLAPGRSFYCRKCREWIIHRSRRAAQRWEKEERHAG